LDGLGKNADFRAIVRTGNRYRGTYVSVYGLPAERAGRRGSTAGGLGLIVNRQVGNAVRRNLVRRRIRETYRAWAKERGFVNGSPLAFVVRAAPATRNASFAALRVDVISGLEQCLVKSLR